MPISDKLKEIYSSNPVNERYYDAIELSHPNFSQSYYFILDNKAHLLKNKAGTVVSFEPMGFELRLPQVGENQQEIQISIDNTSLQLVTELNNASADFKTPITLVASVYVDNDIEIQNQSYTMKIKTISANYSAVVATATSLDTINIQFPTHTFNYDFPGLFL